MKITIQEAGEISKELRDFVEMLEEQYQIKINIPNYSIDGLEFSDGHDVRGFRD